MDYVDAIRKNKMLCKSSTDDYLGGAYDDWMPVLSAVLYFGLNMI
jgi:hypothetical protein